MVDPFAMPLTHLTTKTSAAPIGFHIVSTPKVLVWTQQGLEQLVDSPWYYFTSTPPSVQSSPLYSVLIDTSWQLPCPGSVYAGSALPTAQPHDCLQPHKAME